MYLCNGITNINIIIQYMTLRKLFPQLDRAALLEAASKFPGDVDRAIDHILEKQGMVD